MKRGETGRYETTAAGGEKVHAFIPAPLPPDPALVVDSGLAPRLEAAVVGLGRLDGVSSLLPDRSLFLYSYVRKEAALIADRGNAILRELTGKRRNRLFAYGSYLDILNEGTEPP